MVESYGGKQPWNLTRTRCRLENETSVRGAVAPLPFGDGAFDAVVSVNSLMFGDDPGRAVREAGRVLAPGGRPAVAIWTAPESNEFRHALQTLAGIRPEPPDGGGPFARSGPEILETIFVDVGFEPIEERRDPTPFLFADPKHYLRAVLGTAPGRGVVRQVGEVFVQDDGAYRVENKFRVVYAMLRDE